VKNRESKLITDLNTEAFGVIGVSLRKILIGLQKLKRVTNRKKYKYE
jgi:hypothetical protein